MKFFFHHKRPKTIIFFHDFPHNNTTFRFQFLVEIILKFDRSDLRDELRKKIEQHKIRFKSSWISKNGQLRASICWQKCDYTIHKRLISLLIIEGIIADWKYRSHYESILLYSRALQSTGNLWLIFFTFIATGSAHIDTSL
jgi:hypothetical protein